jgi:hypothetical protein
MDIMVYIKLSEQLQHLSNPQRSDVFVKLFRDAVRVGTFDAVQLPERFTLPKQFRSRISESHYQREVKDMLFEPTPTFHTWFEETNRALAPAHASARVKATVEAIEAGLFDFKAMVEDTRQKMQASHDKGQMLGRRRSGARKGSKRK